MSSITNANEPAVSWPAEGRSRRSGRFLNTEDRVRFWTYISIVAMAVPAAALLFVGVVAGLPAPSGEIESGVRIGGYQVGTGGWEQTEIELQTSLQSYLNEPIILQIGDRTQQVSPAELGIAFDMDATFEKAMNVGRGGVIEGSRERFIARTSGVDVRPVVTYDADQFFQTLTTISSGVVSAPVNASFGVEDNALVIVPSRNGIGINSAEAALLLKEAAGEFNHGPIEVPTVAIIPEVTTTQLEAVFDDANRLAGQPIRLFDRGVTWQLTPAELVTYLRYENNTVSLNMLAIEHRVGTLASTINSSARNAAVEHAGDGTFRIAAGVEERTLDIPATMAALQDALASNQHDVVLVVREQSPTLTADRLQPLYQQISDIMARGMLVTWPEGDQWLNPADYASTFVLNEIEGTISVDRERMTALIQPIADGATRPATGLRWINGGFVTTEDSDPGRAIDVQATVSAAVEGALNASPVIPLVIADAPDPAQTAGDIKLPDLLATATTYYGSSGTNRRINVEVGAAAVDGMLIPPGGTFSFNEAIGGRATLDDGYQMGFGIITGADGVPQTVPSVAGGICLVSTTVFQAAFWAGTEITNRNWHLYWIPDYGEGLGGLKGLDATVDTDWGLDFNFVNTTDQWMAVRSWTDGAYHTVELWGTSQGWTVEVADPVISNVVPADKETVHREESPEVQPGQEIYVETARDGFSAAIHRVVKDRDGNIINDRTFNSYYHPSRNVILVAPGEGDKSKTD
jgi:vancomycin resistance protein YoaR